MIYGAEKQVFSEFREFNFDKEPPNHRQGAPDLENFI